MKSSFPFFSHYTLYPVLYHSQGYGLWLAGIEIIGFSLNCLQAIRNNLPVSEMIESVSVAGPGFVNVTLSREWMAKVLVLNLIVALYFA